MRLFLVFDFYNSILNFNLSVLTEAHQFLNGPAFDCNIRPEDTYQRITKLSLKTTG